MNTVIPTLDTLQEALKTLEEVCPRKKFPMYAKISKSTFEYLKYKFPVVRGNITVGDLPFYVEEGLKFGEFKVYNIDNEEIVL